MLEKLKSLFTLEALKKFVFNIHWLSFGAGFGAAKLLKLLVS